MPLYEYRCTACGKLTEKRQKFSDPELTECPHCGSRLERTITAPAVQFKGGGWYADLYSSGKKPAAAGTAAEGAGSAEAGGSDGKSKPADTAASATASASTPASAPSASTPASSPTKSGS